MRNLSVLLADDEAIVREGLMTYIPWSDYGMEVVGHVENGKQALEIMEQTPIDILISDICMPKMGGLELIENSLFREMKPLVILISGYDDFSYAQKAIKSKIVFEYILKPIDLDELNNVLIAAKKEREKHLKSLEFPVLSEEEWELFAYSKDNKVMMMQNNILKDIKENKKVNAVKHFEEIWQTFLNRKLSDNFIYRYSFELVINIIDMVVEQKKSKELLNEDPISQVALINDIDMLKNYTIQMIELACDALKEKTDNNMSTLVCAALDYVNKNYQDHNLTLNLLADMLNTSANYLSARFKKEIGTGFVRYLNSLRIRKAKELLNDVSLKVYTISNNVGFYDVRYFSRTFRAYTGYTPTEYQKKLSNFET